MYVGGELQECFWEESCKNVCGGRAARMFAGGELQECMWGESCKNVCGRRAARIFVKEEMQKFVGRRTVRRFVSVVLELRETILGKITLNNY